MTAMKPFNPQPKSFKAPAKPRRLAPLSKRRQSKADLRRQVVEFVLRRDGWRCQAAPLLGSHHCAGPSDVHELIRRSAWADGIYHPSNCITICRYHHDWIGANPARATELGLSLPSWTPHCTPTECGCDFDGAA